MRWLLIAALVALIATPLFGDVFYTRLATRILIFGLIAIGLNLIVGYTGLVSFGHAAFVGLGAYTVAILRFHGIESGLVALPAAIGVAALGALVIGAVALRTSGVYFIMITLAFAQMLFFFFHDNLGFGGSDGFYLNNKPKVEIGAITLVDLRNRTEFYYFTLFWLAFTYLFVAMILRAPFGRVIAAIRVNEPRARALGFPTQRYKLASFVIAGMLAGLAGYLTCAQFGVINPAYLSWRESGQALVIVILGGIGTLYGPVLGAFVLVLLEDFVSSLTDHWLLAIGGFVIAVVLFLPDGIASLIDGRLWRRKAPAAEQDVETEAEIAALAAGSPDSVAAQSPERGVGGVRDHS